MLRSVVALVAVTALAMSASDVRAAGELRVGVLYFDNNSGDTSLDGLKKGLADMLVTDLSGVSGMTVVERARLNDVLAELALTQSSYFDPTTAVKLGKGLGASHVVTGAFMTASPKLRVDIRLVKVATGEVVAAEKVVGELTAIFELEQRLVERFVEALTGKLNRHSRAPRTKVKSAAALRAYSSALDAADRGDTKAAKRALDKTIALAPLFVLARERREELIERQKAQEKTRAETLNANEVALVAAAQEVFAAHDIKRVTQGEARELLAWRKLYCGYLLGRVAREHAPARSVSVPLPGRAAAARAAIKALVAEHQLLLTELAIYRTRFIDARGYVTMSFPLPKAAEPLVAGTPLWNARVERIEHERRELLEFLWLGRLSVDRELSVRVGPTPAFIDARYRALAERLANDASRAATVHLAKDAKRGGYLLAELVGLRADLALLGGNVEGAVELLSAHQTKHPTGPRYTFIDRQIQGLLGMRHNADIRKRDRYATGLTTCASMDINVGIDYALLQRLRTEGSAALATTVAEVDTACRTKVTDPKDNLWRTLYRNVMHVAGRQHHCALFFEYGDKWVAAGGSARDYAGYTTNFYPHCTR